MRAGLIGLVGMAALVCAAGCRKPGTFDSASDTGADTVRPVDSGTGVDDTDQAPAEGPQYWSLDGVLVVTGGEVDIAASRLIVDVWRDGRSVCAAPLAPPDTADTAPVDTDVPVDTAIVDTAAAGDTGTPPPVESGTVPLITAAVAADAPADVPAYGWWELTLAEGAAPCSTPLPTNDLRLGIGAMDTRLYPGLDAQGATDPAAYAATLYGAYVEASADAPVWVFGVAGTDDQFAGVASDVTVAPLPDGSYAIRSLFLLPISGS